MCRVLSCVLKIWQDLRKERKQLLVLGGIFMFRLLFSAASPRNLHPNVASTAREREPRGERRVVLWKLAASPPHGAER